MLPDPARVSVEPAPEVPKSRMPPVLRANVPVVELKSVWLYVLRSNVPPLPIVSWFEELN